MKRIITFIQQFWRKLLEYLGILTVTIDIGNEEIRIIETIKFFFSFKVISIKSEKLYDNTSFSFVLERFLQKNTTHKIRRINLTLSSTSIIPLFLNFPGIPRDKINSAVLWEIERNIPLSIDEAYYTYKIVSKVFRDGKDIWNVLAVIAKKEEIDKYVSTFRNLNIIVEDISYLPINILSAIDMGISDNSVGYVYISEHSIELYILLKNKILSFAHYIGDFKNINTVTIKNIVDYFAAFIKQRVAFLERIIVIAKKSTKAESAIVETLMDSLNILTMPASKDDFLPVLRKDRIEMGVYDLMGFVYRSFINLRIAPKTVQQVHLRDAISRTVMVILLVVNIITLAFYPFILSENYRYSIIKEAKSTPIKDISSEKILAMAKTIQKVDKAEALRAKQKKLIHNIQEIESSGVESSLLKVMLSEITRLIPSEVWLKKIEVNNKLGEIEGYSLSTDGLEKFVVYLVNSRVINKVELQKADYVKTSGSTRIRFSIKFGVVK